MFNLFLSIRDDLDGENEEITKISGMQNFQNLRHLTMAAYICIRAPHPNVLFIIANVLITLFTKSTQNWSYDM